MAERCNLEAEHACSTWPMEGRAYREANEGGRGEEINRGGRGRIAADIVWRQKGGSVRSVTSQIQEQPSPARVTPPSLLHRADAIPCIQLHAS
jgi:hypothetical protein